MFNNETRLKQLLSSENFEDFCELINEEIETNRNRLFGASSEHEQTRLLAEINAYEKAKSLPLLALKKLVKRNEIREGIPE